jgi:coenzyme F420-dependent glucose-6-phosphate dehydrogenase
MMKIGYHASHEQFKPAELLKYTRAAEQAGFNAAMCSDHFHPWSRQQGQSGFAWSWLGAAMQATDLPFGVVCAPGQRYHPAVIAQAVGTLLQMYPGRFWLAVGSGQLLNEGITGGEWPMKKVRNERLEESVQVMRRLWEGKKVSHHGHVRVEEAKLYTRPEETPRVIAAALTPETAQWAGGWADGLITVSKPREQLQSMVDAWRRGGGNGKPMHLQVKLSYADSDAAALEGAFNEWRFSILDSSAETELRSPEAHEAASAFVKPEDMRQFVRVSPRLEDHRRWLQEDLDMGFEELYLHNVNRQQRQFIDDFGKAVLPELLRGATRQ